MKKIIQLIIFVISTVAIAQTGITWSPSLMVASASHDNMHPRIVTDASGNPLIIWGRLASNECKFSRWNGTTFTTPVVLNPATIPVFAQPWAGPDIASKGDTVYVVFKGTPEDVNNIYITGSFDGGANFSTPVQVDFISPDVSRFPTVTIDETGNPVVAFMKFDFNFSNARWVVSKSTDYGNTFSPDVLASGWSGGKVCDCCPGSIVCSGSTVAMLYRDNLSNIRDSWCGISSDTGSTFSNGMNIDQNNWMINSCPSTGPDGVIIGDSLYSVFMNGASGSKIYWNTVSLADTQVQVSQLLSSLTSNYPRIANSGRAVAVVWKQTIISNDQLGLRFTNDIDNGLPALYDTVALSGVQNGDVAVFNGNVYVVWQDNNSGAVKYQKGTYTPSTASIEENNIKSGINIYPNPAIADELNLVSENGNILKYTFTNAIGDEVLTGKSSSKIITVDVSSLSGGLYQVQIITENNSATTKIIRQ